MVENNLKFHREKSKKENANIASRQRQQSKTQKNDERTRSFHYAIRQDGTLLGEALWKKRKAEGTAFVFADESTIRKLSSSIPPSQHRQLYLPRSSELTQAKIESLQQSSRLEYERQTSLPAEPKGQKPSNVKSYSSTPTPMHCSSSNSVLNPQNSEQNSFRSNDPSRNNQKQQLEQTNSLPPVQYSRSNSEVSSIIGQRREPPSATHSFSTAADHSRIVQPPEEDEFDDDILDDFDPDQAVSEHKNSSITQRNTENTSFEKTTSFDRRPEPSFNYQAPQAEPRRTNYGDFNANNSGNNSYMNNTSNNQQQHDPYGNDFYGGSPFDDNNNFSTDYPSSTGNSNNHVAQPSNSYGGDNSEDTPLCPGHGLPCRCLTANTSTNMGRQFYKCSLPEGQSCEFFQWKDGMEGNWNDSYSTGGGTNGDINRGQTLDMHEENRRVFGHRSFRKGQKDVIEKAIQGKDVFVLMPTGYVKYFAFHFAGDDLIQSQEKGSAENL